MNLDKYMELEYQIKVYPISEEDGGGWFAEIPDLKGCGTDGDTPQEAITNLEEAKKAWIEVAIKRGIDIPKPSAKIAQEEYSGKFTLRVPTFIHKRLAEKAAQDGISLNQYVNSLIAYHLGEKTAKDSNKSNFTILIQNNSPLSRYEEVNQFSFKKESWDRGIKNFNLPTIFGNNQEVKIQ